MGIDLTINDMDYDAATQISRWNYPGSYSIYNMDGTDACRDELLSGNYFMTHDETGNLLGYFCIGDAATVPAGKKFGVYSDSSLADIGLGMNPVWCGRGLGTDFVRSGLVFVRERFAVADFRLTVAAFNRRAVKVYEETGFRFIDSFIRRDANEEMEFLIMQKNDVL